MDGTAPKIEIFKPFGEAFELTKKILFQPFDLKKWFVIGFAAFLSNLSGGFHFNVGNWNRSGRMENWSSSGQAWNNVFGDTPFWIVVLVISAIVLLAIAVGILCAWLGARGGFMFVDCVVKNRGAIAEPWREFRKEGNSLFLFSLLLGLAFVVATALLVLPFLIPMILKGKFEMPEGLVMISAIVFVGLIMFLLALAWALIRHLMVPIMYRQRILARRAFGVVGSLIATYPGEIVLYCLFLFVLSVAVVLVACGAVCATCCVAAIPYVGTVILLPVFVLIRSFSLLFLRQFGPDYDVWAGFSQPEAAPLPTPPPIQS